MIREAERSGLLQAGMTILDATSGNTGIAYGMIAAARGYPVTICLPKNAGIQRKQILRRYGVQLIETDPLLSTDGAQLVARELAIKEPDKYFYPDQYNNPATGERTTRALPRKFGIKQKDESHTSLLAWEHPGRL